MSSLNDLGEKNVLGFKCPECKETTTFYPTEVGCEDCGSHPAVRCDNCGEDFDDVYSEYDKIIEFNNKIES